ncbi:hypothetical protein AAP_00525 [Ascosphaera apis ARSEF 7405]|uniref:DUF6589 domain-containing protein n=1 Tax=Ascosphaera apis ARSEF 7405 TaxID=392613 RepID=A0A162IPH1_9EURO|nr:hypothetical protein AAP_00525 [Ascosphaera apis ARSEF 7405]
MIKEVAKNHRNQLVIVWDNFDFTETVHYESLSKPSQHFSATTGLMVHSQHIPAEGIRLTEFNSEIPLDSSVFYYAPGNSEDQTQYQARLYFFFEAIRYTHPGVIDKIFGANSSSRPRFPHKQCLEPNKTVRYEMGPIMENENSVSGTLSVMNHILLQVLGYDIEDPEFGQYIQLTYGDQKTVSLVQSVKRMRKYSEHVYERFQSFLPIPGLFHYKMNFIDLIFSHFSGKGEQQRCPSSVKHNEHHMGIAKGNVLPFHHKEQVLTRCFDARVLAMLYDNIQDSTEVDTTDVDEIEEYLQTLTPDEFLEKLSSMVRHTFSKEALSPFNTNDTSVDQTHRVSCQFLDVMVTYRELKHAIKFGDIGYLKRLFPRIAMIFAGSNKTKYCGITLYMTWLLETEAASQTLKHAILANSLVNTSGRKDGFYEIDRLNEFTNYRLRLLMKSRSSNEELKDLFRRMALSSAYTAIVKEGLEEFLRI